MSEKIIEALSKLDVKNDNHWTADGLPRLDTVKMLANEQGLTREALSTAAPGFTRATATAPAAAQAEPVAPVTPAPVVDAAAAPAAVVQPVVTPPAPTPPVTDPVVEAAPAATAAEKLAVAKEELVALTKLKVETDIAHGAKVRQVDALIIAAEKEAAAGDSNADGIRQYLNQQVANGLERARRMEALKGVDLKAILPTKAPIDVAMSRKTSRGSGRPFGG